MKQLTLSIAVFTSFATSTVLAEQSRTAPQVDTAVVIYNLHDKVQDPLYSFIQPQVEVAATQQAQIWGDTILEGDYVADGQTQVDEVIALYKSNILQGYKFTYSEKAWMTSDCDYNSENEESLSTCVEGRIVESSYITADFKTIERDEANFAEFFQK